MLNEGFFIYNGKFISSDDAIISPNNRSFRYGDGFFETMLWIKGEINFWEYHKDRINDSITALGFDKANNFSTDNLIFLINKLVHKNKISNAARIRISFFRGDGGLYDAANNHIHFIIQCWTIQSTFHLYKENGLDLGIFTDGIKVSDRFSRIKSNSALPYVMAAMWAKENKHNDAILLNQNGRIADTTIANVFIVNKKEQILTPALSEGCVDGILRRVIIEQSGREVIETEITADDVLYAKELFLTNAIKGIMWVHTLQDKKYEQKISQDIYHLLHLNKYK